MSLASFSRRVPLDEDLPASVLAGLAFPASVERPGARCFTMRSAPTSTVAAVVPAIIGKLLMRGLPMANALSSMSLSSGRPDAVITTSGTASAIVSGGCTIGPKRLLR
nr:hypothetical protein [Saccharomonospora xinjiangensis]